MTNIYAHILDVVNEAEPPADSILSRTIFQDDFVKAVVFGFRTRGVLSEWKSRNRFLRSHGSGSRLLGEGVGR